MRLFIQRECSRIAPHSGRPGTLTEVRVYNRALSAAEITTLYALDAGITKSLDIAVETVRLTMHVVPGKRYLLQSSSDLKSWVDFGTAFVPDTAVYQATVNVGGTWSFWRVVEAR